MEMYSRGHKPESTSHNEQVMRYTNEDVSFLMMYFNARFIKMSPGLNGLGVQQVRGSWARRRRVSLVSRRLRFFLPLPYRIDKLLLSFPHMLPY